MSSVTRTSKGSSWLWGCEEHVSPILSQRVSWDSSQVSSRSEHCCHRPCGGAFVPNRRLEVVKVHFFSRQHPQHHEPGQAAETMVLLQQLGSGWLGEVLFFHCTLRMQQQEAHTGCDCWEMSKGGVESQSKWLWSSILSFHRKEATFFFPLMTACAQQSRF